VFANFKEAEFSEFAGVVGGDDPWAIIQLVLMRVDLE
jgi:hypothetical protein